MAPGGRTWAQIAAGLPASTEAEPSRDTKATCAAGEAAQIPSVPTSAVEDDHEVAASKACDTTQGGAEPAESIKAEGRVAMSKHQKGEKRQQRSKDSKVAARVDAGAPANASGDMSSIEMSSSPPTSRHGSMAVEDATDLSTTASDHERAETCILCQGSGLLDSGRLPDPCPLCGDQKPPPNGNPTSDDSSCAPASEIDRAEQSGVEDADQNCKDNSQPFIPETSTVVKEDGTAITAPPGLGPPGVWIWHTATAAEDTDAAKPEGSQEDENKIDWPMNKVSSPEVEFVGKCAQNCFGLDFIKMTITWITPFVHGQISMPAADLQLHLGPMANANLLTPLARLQVVMARDQKAYSQNIFRMDRSKDDTLMYMTCSQVSMSTCWDVLKTGICPRPHCTWEHPAPTIINVSCAGQTLPKQHTPLATLKSPGQTLPKQHTPLATLISRPKASPSSDKIQSQESPAPEPAAETPSGPLNQIQLNLGAYDTDDSSDEA